MQRPRPVARTHRNYSLWCSLKKRPCIQIGSGWRPDCAPLHGQMALCALFGRAANEPKIGLLPV